jgi:3-methyladenine DNA glycosylase AlkD
MAALPVLREVMRPLKRELSDISHDQLWPLIETLWQRQWHEDHVVAIGLLTHFHKRLETDNMARLEQLLRTSYTWAYVDALAGDVVGRLVSSHPLLKGALAQWAVDPDFWIRRSALLALLRDLRAGAGDFDLFQRLAVPMLPEREFFIRKAVGWVLREVSKDVALVADFVARHGAAMSGLTRREATSIWICSGRQSAVSNQPPAVRASFTRQREQYPPACGEVARSAGGA